MKANYLNFRKTDLSPWIICEEFKDDVESFKEYLKGLNKTYGSAGEGLRVYYSPLYSIDLLACCIISTQQYNICI